MTADDLVRFSEVPLKVEALIPCPRMRISDLLALRPGSIVEAGRLAGENVDVLAGNAFLGIGELTKLDGKLMLRILGFRGED
jgi:flagellar motor switch/type III secretory pathway protein FliN